MPSCSSSAGVTFGDPAWTVGRCGAAGRWLSLALVGTVLGLLPAGAGPWPEVVSDLKPDSNVVWGALPNGLRYAILPNAEPKDRISLRLVVAAGSLLEQDDEAGLAHFVEHMAFRATRTHPAGSLTNALERLGIAIGPDSTAFTNYDYVIFHLELPNARDDILRTGLQTFREYAEELTFDPDLIERERGVILNEMAMRANSDFYLGCANTAFLWPASRRAARVPIGTAASVRQCSRQQLVAFYDAWYRPSRIAVIAVGSVEPDLTARLISEIFGPMRDRGPPRAEPADLSPAAASAPNIKAYSDAVQSGVTFVFEHPEAFPRAADTHARRVELLYRALAFAMFQSRLDKFSRKFSATFVGPRAELDYGVPGWQTAYLSAGSKVDDCETAATNLEEEHRRALLQGFTEPELQIAKANFAMAYDEGVRMAGTRPSPMLAAELAGALLYGRVVASPAEMRSDMSAALAAATIAQCNAAFRGAWTGAPPHVLVATNRAVTVKLKALGDLLNKSRETATSDRLGPSDAAFAYTDFGPPGMLVRDERLADLDAHLAEFANGVRLNFKPTAFVADWVEVMVRVGTGRLSQPESRQGLNLLAGAALLDGGLGKHERQDLNDLLAGHGLQVQFGVGSDALVFSVACVRRDLAMAMRYVAAYLTDAAYRGSAMVGARAQFTSLYASLAQSPGGPILQKAERILAGGDRRFGIPDQDDLLSRDLPTLKAWLEPQFKTGPIEVAAVGDATWDEVREAVAQTIGALPARQPRSPPGPEAELRFPPPGERRHGFETPPAIQQVAIGWAWPVTDARDRRLQRRCRFLAAVIAERLRVQVREQLGATYAPTAAFVNEEGFPGFAYLWIYLEVLPNQAKGAIEAMWQAVGDLQKKGISEDEFNRVRQPMLRAIDDEARTNAYWLMTVLAAAQQRPESLAAARDRTADYASVKSGELAELAKRYLVPAKVYIFAAVPKH